MWVAVITGVASFLVALAGAGAFTPRLERLRRQISAEQTLLQELDGVVDTQELKKSLGQTVELYATLASPSYRLRSGQIRADLAMTIAALGAMSAGMFTKAYSSSAPGLLLGQLLELGGFGVVAGYFARRLVVKVPWGSRLAARLRR